MSRSMASVVSAGLLVGLSACGRSDINAYADYAQDGSSLDASLGDSDAADSDAQVGDATPDAPKTCGECNGCCLDGTCIALQKETASECGFGGNACESFGPSGKCLKGACVHPQPDCGPSNCTGCCYDANDCSDGISADACGHGGGQCQGCGPLENAKTCVPQPGGGGSCQTTCGPENCHGCCDGTTCLLGQSDSSCGSHGEACVACPQGESCKLFGPGTGGTCDLPCSPQSCKGCCAGEVCAIGNQDIACGTGGEACADCTGEHFVCASGVCEP